jgi:hypothetical protein
VISGKYVKTFAEASHAIPADMHMNADYPLMLPMIVRVDSDSVVLRGRDKEYTAAIKRSSQHGEYCEIAQRSTFEVLFSRPPHRFKFWPFKDEHTLAAPSSGLFAANTEGGAS